MQGQSILHGTLYNGGNQYFSCMYGPSTGYKKALCHFASCKTDNDKNLWPEEKENYLKRGDISVAS